MSQLKIIHHSKGFTIIELLISTAVFSVVLLLCATAAVQVGRTFYKGVLVNRVQDTSRKVVEDVTQSVQFGINAADFYHEGGVSGATETRCLGEIRYTFNTKNSLGNGGYKHILWKDRVSKAEASACAPVDLTRDTPTPKGQELLGSNMRIPVFITVESPINSVISWKIAITVSYGDADDLFTLNDDSTPNYTQCVSEQFGGQFCAVSSINTNAEKRL